MNVYIVYNLNERLKSLQILFSRAVLTINVTHHVAAFSSFNQLSQFLVICLCHVQSSNFKLYWPKHLCTEQSQLRLIKGSQIYPLGLLAEGQSSLLCLSRSRNFGSIKNPRLRKNGFLENDLSVFLQSGEQSSFSSRRGGNGRNFLLFILPGKNQQFLGLRFKVVNLSTCNVFVSGICSVFCLNQKFFGQLCCGNEEKNCYHSQRQHCCTLQCRVV